MENITQKNQFDKLKDYRIAELSKKRKKVSALGIKLELAYIDKDNNVVGFEDEGYKPGPDDIPCYALNGFWRVPGGSKKGITYDKWQEIE